MNLDERGRNLWIGLNAADTTTSNTEPNTADDAMTRILILRAPGTNCDQETAFAFERAGAAVADVVHINRLLESQQMVTDYQVLCLPGGFSYGDDIAAGCIVAGQIRHHLIDVFQKFRDDGKLVLGICNGFQVLLKAGLLAAGHPTPATLTWNDSGRFEDRWVHLEVDGRHSPFLHGIERMYLPIAHAEGKFVTRDEHQLSALASNGQLAIRYAHAESEVPTNGVPLPFPWNPNGSQGNVAGICDATGRILGLMPHPERFIERTHHPKWTRRPVDASADGLAVFRNAVRYFQ